MFLPKSGGKYCCFYSNILRIKPEKIDNEAIEAPNKSMKVNKIDAVEENIGSTTMTIESGEGDNKNDSEAPKNGKINSEVINTHTDYGIKKDYPTSPEMWTEHKDWSRTNENHRI